MQKIDKTYSADGINVKQCVVYFVSIPDVGGLFCDLY